MPGRRTLLRTPSNERARLDIDDATAGPEQSGPVRSCILTRIRGERGGLIRLALSPDGQVLPDIRAKAPGRGAWIGVGRAELETALAKGKLRGALARAFKTNDLAIPADLPALIATQLERAALDRLGLEAKAGNLLTGSDKIAEAARSGRLHLLAHASDAGADGAGKLAQAWRVGSDREGSGLKGLVLPLPRTTLSLALGRENVVHIGLTDRAAAGRVKESLDRWLHFIGPEPGPVSCDSTSQGASAPGIDDGADNSAAQKEDL
jgi:predicted RNA-binding protein YlxR (DUF448 family)